VVLPIAVVAELTEHAALDPELHRRAEAMKAAGWSLPPDVDRLKIGRPAWQRLVNAVVDELCDDRAWEERARLAQLGAPQAKPDPTLPGNLNYWTHRTTQATQETA
jgi:hypothetical protein